MSNVYEHKMLHLSQVACTQTILLFLAVNFVLKTCSFGMFQLRVCLRHQLPPISGPTKIVVRPLDVDSVDVDLQRGTIAALAHSAFFQVNRVSASRAHKQQNCDEKRVLRSSFVHA